MSLVLAGKIAWAVMVVGWYLLRWPFQRRAKKVALSDDRMKLPERLRLATAITGLGIVPFVFVVFGEPRIADYTPHPALFAAGMVAAIFALVLFRLTHKALGRMWSVSLQVKQNHTLVTTGVYSRVRHPMYSAFWLMAAAQALLLPNLVAGLAGAAGFGLLYFSRIGPEERMMEQAFGEQYLAYRRRTRRIIPSIRRGRQ
jgi:protein-S-isoprenylcysteine O-methyltransferase Ste14